MSPEGSSDRAAIDSVLMRYYRGIDRTDFDLVRSCFFDDAELDYGPWFQGGLDDFISYAEGPTGLAGQDRTFHFAGNTIIDIDGDRAHSEVYVMAQHWSADAHEWAGAFVTTWLRYIDRFERRKDGWRIASRQVVIEAIRQDTAGMWLDVPPSASGRRDRTDIVYAR